MKKIALFNKNITKRVLGVILFLAFSLFGETSFAQITCSCNEYIYLNEVSNGGKIHKFRVNPDGSVTEINPTNTWYPGGNGGSGPLSAPHGLGTDLNGYLYVADSPAPDGNIYKLNCDGKIINQPNFPIPNAGTYNLTSIGNTLYSNYTGSTNVVSYDLCTVSSKGEVCFQPTPASGVPDSDWGFYYDKRTGYFYTIYTANGAQTQGAIYRYTASDFGSGVCVPTFITAGDGVVNVGDKEMPWNRYSGITTDNLGNIYVVGGGNSDPGKIIKFDKDGRYLATSVIDNVNGDGGYFGARAIVWSETSNKIYVSTQQPLEDCLAQFDTNLNYEGAAVGPTGVSGAPNFGTAKAMAINVECCPVVSNPVNINVTYCGAVQGQQIPLIKFLPCEFICAGEWSVLLLLGYSILVITHSLSMT